MEPVNKRSPIKWNSISFRDKIAEISPEIQVIGEYSKMSDHIECRCSICGTIWFPIAGNLIRGTRCPECKKVRTIQSRGHNSAKRTVWNQESFLHRVSEIDSTIEVLSDYTNTSSKIQCRCTICGTEWFPTANNLIQGRSHCPNCSKKTAALKSGLTEEDFIQRVTSLNDSIEILGRFVGTKSRIKCKCKKCGNIWYPIADSLLSGRGCRKCAYVENGTKAKLSQEEFKKRLFSVNKNIVAIGEYRGIYESVKCRCLVCNNEWEAVPHYLLTGRGCPNCAHTSTSYVEQFILNAFKFALGNELVISRDRKTIGEELDILIPCLHFAIEPGSWQLHYKKLEKDIQKNKLCCEVGIKLITVYYDYIDYIGPKISNLNAITFATDISLPKERQTLIKLVESLFEMANVQMTFSNEDWERISNIAYTNSRRMTTDQFVERLSSINSNIQVLGEYKGSKIKILCKCKICRSKWEVTPEDLLAGKGCPTCYDNRRGATLKHSQSDFIRLVGEKNPYVEVVGEYKGNKNTIECVCKKCGYRWEPVAGRLINARANGCPKCAGTMKITTDTFISQMASINPQIEILGKYINTDTKIECRCKKCGYHWCTTPHILKQGHGCPRCSKSKEK